MHVRIVALLGLILHVRRVDRDSARLLLRRLIDLIVSHGLRFAELRQHHGDRSRQRGLAVVYVSNRSQV